MTPLALGARVRVAPREELLALLRGPDAAARPSPEQRAFAGRSARVVGVRLADGAAPVYELSGAPGLWLGEWLRLA